MESASAAPSVESERELAEHVRAERIRFVFIQSLLPIIFSPLAAAVLSIVLWHVVDRRVLVSWTTGLVLLAVLRAALMRAFPKTAAANAQLFRWERLFVASILLVDLWWGIGALFLLVPGMLVESAMVFCFVMLMAGGHTASYSAHPVTVNLGVLALTLPITVWFALEPDKYHWAMAFISIMFLAASFRSIKTLGFFFGRTYRLAHELQRERDRASKLARSDFLTGLNNRRAFYELGEAALQHAAQPGSKVSVVMLDIDHFKSINDRYGHSTGDAVIRAVAAMIVEKARATDFAGRLGGEEFAVLLPDTHIEDAAASARELTERIAAQEVRHEQHAIAFTISAGVATLHAGDTLDQLIARADAALYTAKREGRNRVVTESERQVPAASIEPDATRTVSRHQPRS